MKNEIKSEVGSNAASDALRLKATNAALLEALKAIAATFEQPGWTGTRSMQCQRDTVIKEARAVIALVEK